MTSKKDIDFTVYEREPLMILITKIKSITPIKLGIAFFVIGMSLHLVAYLTDSDLYGVNTDIKKTFLLNTSWSFAIICLYPFIVGLTLKYYREIPKTFDYIFNKLVKDGLAEKDFEEMRRCISSRFNNYYIFPITLALTLLLNYVYSENILNNVDTVGWMNNVENKYSFSDTATVTGFTIAGLYATVIQVVLVYWVINLLLRGVIFTWSLYYIFNKKSVSYQLDPLHSDSCFGLKIIGEVSMILNSILFMLGIYISLKVVDKTIVQGLPLTSDIASPMMLVSFAILAPVLFFFPLGAAHHHMRKAKDVFLGDISGAVKNLHTTMLGLSNVNEKLECTQSIKELIEYSNIMKENLFVWPFNFKSIEAFFAVIVVPFLPVVLPLILASFTVE